MHTLTAPSPRPRGSFFSALGAPDDDVVRDPRARAVLRAGALYDLVVTLPFATPITAALVLSGFRMAHDALGLGGSSLPSFGPTHLLFVSFFGTVVSFWSYLRLRSHARRLHALDTVGRFVFSAWQLWALAKGASPLLVPFLVVELGFGVTQALAVRKP
ncbi:MAG: hypothetical protein U0183_32125 [Polyangiaceae bacterium]